MGDDNVKVWQKLVEPIQAAWVKQVADRGADGSKLLASAQELIAKHQTT
jgi:hypothetical protein